MDALIFSANVVLPLLLMMVTGFICRRFGLIDDAMVKSCNKLVFKVFLPMSLFYSVLTTPYDTQIPVKMIVYVVACTLASMAFIFWLIPRIEKDRRKIGVMIQGMFRGNYAIFGIPMVGLLFPGENTSVAAILVIFIVPLYNVMAVIALSVYADSKPDLLGTVKRIITNPLIVATLGGFVCWILRVQLPAPVNTALSKMGSIATNLALVLLGAAIHVESIRSHKKQLSLMVSTKLVILPLLFVTGAGLLGIRGIPLACVLIAFAAPTSVSSFTMTQQIGGDDQLAAEQVALTSAGCVLTVFLFIFGMKALGWI